tara:strand:+ start:286 stop:1323 length:1038 start_codon:yes stop_codon:yes gene_type:complete
MKVGITTYPVAFQRKGGLEVQIRQTMQALQGLGVETTLVDLSREKLKNFDIIHHFSHSSFRIFESAQSSGIPLVLSPLVELVQSRLRLHKIRFINYALHKAFGQEFRTRWHDTMGSLRLANAILPLTEAENSVIKGLVPEVADRTQVVPNGITEDFFAASPTLFRTTYPDLREFVLVASSIVPYKNQLAVIRAARAAGYHTVLVGSKSSEDYFGECMQAGGTTVTYLGELEYPSPMLTSLFAAAGVVVLASMQEPFGLVPFEALAAGTPSILTTRSGVDWEGNPPYFQRVRPDSDDDIYNALRTAMEAPPNPSACMQLVQDMRWNAVAQRILGIYESVLQERASR